MDIAACTSRASASLAPSSSPLRRFAACTSPTCTPSHSNLDISLGREIVCDEERFFQNTVESGSAVASVTN